MDFHVLPLVNAILNGTAGLLLIGGWVAIRRGQVALHKKCMLTALGVSALFLTSYLTHQFLKGGPTYFKGPETATHIYYTILISHTLLAMAAAPLAIITAYLGVKDRLARHVRLARWTLPIWLYVSVTGVVVYVMLYQLYPPA